MITSKQTLIWISPVLLISRILFGHKWKSDYVMIWDIQGWCAMVSLLNSKSIGFRTGNSDPILEENNAGNCHKCPIIQSSMDSRVKTSTCLVNDRCTCPSWLCRAKKAPTLRVNFANCKEMPFCPESYGQVSGWFVCLPVLGCQAHSLALSTQSLSVSKQSSVA